MPTHDCKTCKAKEACPLIDIAPWLNEHEDEVNSSKKNVSDKIGEELTRLVMTNPMSLLLKDELVGMALVGYTLGYHQGRTFQSVPKVFEEA